MSVFNSIDYLSPHNPMEVLALFFSVNLAIGALMNMNGNVLNATLQPIIPKHQDKSIGLD